LLPAPVSTRRPPGAEVVHPKSITPNRVILCPWKGTSTESKKKKKRVNHWRADGPRFFFNPIIPARRLFGKRRRARVARKRVASSPQRQTAHPAQAADVSAQKFCIYYISLAVKRRWIGKLEFKGARKCRAFSIRNTTRCSLSFGMISGTFCLRFFAEMRFGILITDSGSVQEPRSVRPG